MRRMRHTRLKAQLTLRKGRSYHRIPMPRQSESQPQQPTERVFLIDSMSHIFRAFFAPMSGRMEPLTNSQGQVTQAVFIFTSMLRKLLADEQPHYIAAVFESAEPTFRHDSYADYKANRAEMPGDLSSQLPYIIRVCEVFNIPILQSTGYEADDVIGALALQAADRGLQAVVVSNDKDLCQLVRDPFVPAPVTRCCSAPRRCSRCTRGRGSWTGTGR